MIYKYNREEFIISTDKRKLQPKVIHHFLTNCYWDKGVSMKEVQMKIKNSLCYGVYHKSKQVGFGRIITDYITFSYLADVFIIEKYRKLGLSKWLMESILEHPDLKKSKSWMLKTADAQGLYKKFGFKTVANAEKIMEKETERRNK